MTTTGLRLTPRAEVGEVTGRPVVLHHGDPASEYHALRTRSAVVDRSHRTRTHITGAEAPKLLTGLVSNDVMSLVPGHGQYAAALTAKGKIVADVRILRVDDGLLVDVPPRAAAGWLEMLRKFIPPRLARCTDVTEQIRTIGVFGPRAAETVLEATAAPPAELAALSPYAFIVLESDGQKVLVMRSPEVGAEGYELFVPNEMSGSLWQAMVDAGAAPAGLTAWEIARIEAGRPEWGLDIDDSTLPQEANFDELQAISYTKGCYVGQETVARIHFRGHVNRQLRGLRYASPEPPPHGASLADGTGKPVGDVRSAVISPRLGGIGIGMVRREVEVGTALTATWEGGECRMDVSHLPFPI